MPKCERCGVEATLPFKCNFCGCYFCMEHRLPENHDCPNAPVRTPLGSCQSKNAIIKESEESRMQSEGTFHFEKKSAVSYSPRNSKSFPVKKIVAFLSILGIVAILLWQSPTILSLLKSSPFSGYTKVTLVASQPNSIQFGNNVYGLGYAGPEINPLTGKSEFKFAVVPQGIIGMKTYDAVEGAVYRDLGLEIVVGEVHNDYIILWIKSTVPNP